MVASLVTVRRLAVVCTLSISVNVLLVFSWYVEWRPEPDVAVVSNLQAQTTTEKEQPAACLEGVVTVQPDGRLGNLILEYASAATVARRHRLKLAAPSAICKSLSPIFGNLTAEPLSLLLEQPPCIGLNLTEEKVLNDQQKQPPHSLTTEEEVSWARNRHLPLILKRWIVLSDYIAPSMQFLRQELRFRSEIQSAANKKLDKVISETAQKTGFNKTQVCTVGVHVRRTDYGDFMKRRFHLQQEAGPAFYEAARDAMLADLRSECAAIAFAVTSDDSRWCQEHLLPSLNRNASEHAAASVGFLMTSQNPADDLCLLTSCQHLIMAYGTFGLTAAILSGGRTIMYDTAQHGAGLEPHAQKMAPLVPHWRLIP